ncbi:SMR family transporter [Salinicola peritrichatus]|uniref:SMR family transporter n=1 Tax=Salinicola peritrichatus TaxID=1267424 RepID=UPI003B8349C4
MDSTCDIWPLARAYAIWTAIGTKGPTLLGVVLFGENKRWTATLHCAYRIRRSRSQSDRPLLKLLLRDI